MRGGVWRAAAAAIAISLCMLSARAVAGGRLAQVAENVSDRARAATEPGRPDVAGASAALPANSPAQIRRAQIELRRLDCLNGRIDGKLRDRTRQAVQKFWASAKEPAAEVNITDAFIAELAERGDNFCRPPRRYFAIGGRAGGNPALPLFPGARPIPVPVPTAPPASPAPAN